MSRSSHWLKATVLYSSPSLTDLLSIYINLYWSIVCSKKDYSCALSLSSLFVTHSGRELERQGRKFQKKQLPLRLLGFNNFQYKYPTGNFSTRIEDVRSNENKVFLWVYWVKRMIKGAVLWRTRVREIIKIWFNPGLFCSDPLFTSSRVLWSWIPYPGCFSNHQPILRLTESGILLQV